jgi:hypothetical protein
MGNTGFELPAFRSGEIEIGIIRGAESGALRPGTEPVGRLDPALALVARRWPTLTAEQRLAILEIIAAGIALEAEPEALSVARR